MAFPSKRRTTATGLMMGLLVACTPAHGPLYILSSDGAVAIDGVILDAAVGPETAPGIDVSRCSTSCASLPVVVDAPGNFVASGYTGDWPGIKEVSSASDLAACSPTRAHAGAAGNCHHWTWQFSNGVCNSQSCPKWACAAWLRPVDLYTSSTPNPAAGLPVAAGAKTVHFWAWSTSERSLIFSVGNDDTNAAEGFYARVDATLTSTPTRFSIDVSAINYNIVNTGFRWCTNNDPRFEKVDFYVDDIQWTAEP